MTKIQGGGQNKFKGKVGIPKNNNGCLFGLESGTVNGISAAPRW